MKEFEIITLKEVPSEEIQGDHNSEEIKKLHDQNGDQINTKQWIIETVGNRGTSHIVLERLIFSESETVDDEKVKELARIISENESLIADPVVNKVGKLPEHGSAQSTEKVTKHKIKIK